MKKISALIVTSFAICAGAAQADTIRLADVYTNSCDPLASEVNLLNSAYVSVRPSCEYGSFMAPNGLFYSSRLTTFVSVPYAVLPGTRIELAGIDTRDCGRAQSMIALLNGGSANVDTFCQAGDFQGHNGEIYPFRLMTTVTAY